jgi:hypothetical protein
MFADRFLSLYTMAKHIDLMKDYCRRFPDRCKAVIGFGPCPSPRAHIYRLLLILGAAFLGFLGAQGWGKPEGWNEQDWYRLAALQELRLQPVKFSPKSQCLNCHEQRRKHMGGEPIRCSPAKPATAL